MTELTDSNRSLLCLTCGAHECQLSTLRGPYGYACRRSAVGHEYQFPPPNLSAGCGFSKQTFAGMAGKEEDAPIPDLAFSGAVSGSAIADLQFS